MNCCFSQFKATQEGGEATVYIHGGLHVYLEGIFYYQNDRPLTGGGKGLISKQGEAGLTSGILQCVHELKVFI